MTQANQIYKTWTELKLFLSAPKELKLQYHEFDYYYHIFTFEAGYEYFTELWIDTSKVQGIDITQNNLDKTDFEDNYKASANQAIELDVNVENDITVGSLVDEPYKGKYISKKLEYNGSPDMTIDGSGSGSFVEFIAAPGTGKKWYVSRMILTMEDENINHTKFAGLPSPLENGIDIKITEDGEERTLAAGLIKTNHEFYQLCYDVTIKSSVTDILAMRWTFAKGGTFLRFKNSTNDKFSVIINDDLSSINAFQVIIQGYEVDE